MIRGRDGQDFEWPDGCGQAVLEVRIVSTFLPRLPSAAAELPHEITAARDFTVLCICVLIALLGAESVRGDLWNDMDYGPFLTATIEVEPDNIVGKGLAIRLDDGPGGVARDRRSCSTIQTR